MRSALYPGVVRHRRHAPPGHALRFRGLWVYLDLEEGEEAFRASRLWSAGGRRAISLGSSASADAPGPPLAEVVRTRVAACTGRRPAGPVGLLAMPRLFGVGFDPVRFFYCWDAAGERLEALVADVTNTPWHERHAYVVDAAGSAGGLDARVAKTFHVSPFLPMDLAYRFRVRPPGARLALGIRVQREGRPVFDASLALRRQEIDAASLARAAWRVPLQPVRVLGGIYLHALRLFLRRAPFHPHPDPSVTPRAPASLPR